MVCNGSCAENEDQTFSAPILCPLPLRRLSGTGMSYVFAALVLLLCNGCTTPSQTSSSLPEQPIASTPVSLSPGDVIKLSFSGSADLNQTQKIRADGKVSLPLIGEVTAARKTVVDFQNELTRLYASQLRNNDVLVTLESGIVQVVVSGEVQKASKFTFDRPTTVFQAIMEAGGVTQFGSLKKVRLIRTISGKQQSQVFDLTPTLKGHATQGIYIRDGDVIFVPASAF